LTAGRHRCGPALLTAAPAGDRLALTAGRCRGGPASPQPLLATGSHLRRAGAAVTTLSTLPPCWRPACIYGRPASRWPCSPHRRPGWRPARRDGGPTPWRLGQNPRTCLLEVWHRFTFGLL